MLEVSLAVVDITYYSYICFSWLLSLGCRWVWVIFQVVHGLLLGKAQPAWCPIDRPGMLTHSCLGMERWVEMYVCAAALRAWVYEWVMTSVPLRAYLASPGGNLMRYLIIYSHTVSSSVVFIWCIAMIHEWYRNPVALANDPVFPHGVPVQFGYHKNQVY